MFWWISLHQRTGLFNSSQSETLWVNFSIANYRFTCLLPSRHERTCAWLQTFALAASFSFCWKGNLKRDFMRIRPGGMVDWLEIEFQLYILSLLLIVVGFLFKNGFRIRWAWLWKCIVPIHFCRVVSSGLVDFQLFCAGFMPQKLSLLWSIFTAWVSNRSLVLDHFISVLVGMIFEKLNLGSSAECSLWPFSQQ